MDNQEKKEDSVKEAKGKLFKKAAEKRAAKKAASEGESNGAVAEARRRFEENRRLQGVG